MNSTGSPNIRVDIVSDVVCPWCIIGYGQLKAAADALGQTVDVHWHPYELNPDMPAEGQNLRQHISEKYGSSADESARTRAAITELGQQIGFTFDFKPESRIMNTLKAHILLHWAASKDRQHELKMILVRKYFTEGYDISDPDVLLDAVKELALDTTEAKAALDDQELARQVREEERFWLSKGVSGVPSMVFQQQYLVTGAQGVESYKQIIQQLIAANAA